MKTHSKKKRILFFILVIILVSVTIVFIKNRKEYTQPIFVEGGRIRGTRTKECGIAFFQGIPLQHLQ